MNDSDRGRLKAFGGGEVPIPIQVRHDLNEIAARRKDSGRLILTRRLHDSICIGDDIEIEVTAIEGGKIRLAVEAPRCVRIDRHEIRCLRAELGQDSAA